MAPDPANSLISSLKKNLAENYMAPDPANFLISSLKRIRLLAPAKRIGRKNMARIWL
jgi:hypothetical protein